MPAPCIHCAAPWPDRVLDIDHRSDCPFTTNLWPVLPQDIAPHGFGCLRCSAEFVVGDRYTRLPHNDDDGHTHDDIVEIVCLSCAAAEVCA